MEHQLDKNKWLRQHEVKLPINKIYARIFGSFRLESKSHLTGNKLEFSACSVDIVLCGLPGSSFHGEKKNPYMSHGPL
jgi:hypothetical protein